MGPGWCTCWCYAEHCLTQLCREEIQMAKSSAASTSTMWLSKSRSPWTLLLGRQMAKVHRNRLHISSYCRNCSYGLAYSQGRLRMRPARVGRGQLRKRRRKWVECSDVSFHYTCCTVGVITPNTLLLLPLYISFY
jgi:hypothetical protein